MCDRLTYFYKTLHFDCHSRKCIKQKEKKSELPQFLLNVIYVFEKICNNPKQICTIFFFVLFLFNKYTENFKKI